jgi:aspartate-semialdehyde dehydrogenase
MSDNREAGSPQFRVALAGATGALGSEVLAVLEERRFPLSQLLPFATEGSLGEDVEIRGEDIPVGCEMPPLRGLDLLIVCTPPAVALELVREALRAEVPCIDCSGALAGSPEVPLQVADLCAPDSSRNAPVIATPAGPTLAWAHVLSALEGAAGIERVVGTVLQSAAHAGRRGIAALSNETLSLLSQEEAPPSDVFTGQVAFDCIPAVGSARTAVEGDSEEPPPVASDTGVERSLVRDLRRLINPDLSVAVSVVQVPTFLGDGSNIAVETRRSIEPAEVAAIFQKVPGVEVWGGGPHGPTTRDTAGRDGALVGRLRADTSRENGLLLWVAADALRLAAVNAVKLAETRLGIL